MDFHHWPEGPRCMDMDISAIAPDPDPFRALYGSHFHQGAPAPSPSPPTREGLGCTSFDQLLENCGPNDEQPLRDRLMHQHASALDDSASILDI